jgi:hypothetical protein
MQEHKKKLIQQRSIAFHNTITKITTTKTEQKPNAKKNNIRKK